LTLYGFESLEELEVFGLLLGVSGVGPRSALGVLSEMTPLQIAQAASMEDEKPFRKVSGIGPKTARLIAVQLAGKLDPRSLAHAGNAAESETAEADHENSRASANVMIGLVGLGYAQVDAEHAVHDALQAGAPVVESELLRAALALLQAPRPTRESGAGGFS